MTTSQYPEAQRERTTEVIGGVTVADPYRWLEPESSAETVQWSAAQAGLWDEVLASSRAALADGPFETARLTARLGELLGAGHVSPPVWRGSVRFGTRRLGDQEHAVVVVADAPGDDERVLLDPMVLDPAGTTTLDAWSPSPDGALLAYQTSEGGTEESRLTVIDVTSGATVDGPIDRARYSPVAWLPDGSAFYYVRRLSPELVPAGEQQFHRRVSLHRVGTPTSQDVEVFGDGHDKSTYYSVQVSRDGAWLIVSESIGTAPRSDVWIADLDAGDPAAPTFVPVAVGLDAETAAWIGRDGRLWVLTDLDAPRQRLCVTAPQHPGPEHWTTLVPEHPEAVLVDVAVTTRPDAAGLPEPHRLVVAWRHHTVSVLTVHDPATGERLPGADGKVPLPGKGSVGGLVTRRDGGHELWFSYTDHVTPSTVWQHDTINGATTVWAAPPGAVAAAPAVTVKHREVSSGGTTVRAFVICRSDLLTADGHPLRPSPTVVYGYGGFQISMDPGYSATTLAWVEAGGVWVVAQLRGGGEEGEQWHRDGMREHKQHVFDDLYAVTESLVSDGWTTPDLLACWGGSNGGLLVGAAVTQRPELWRAAVCSAPLLDMVRYQRFGLGQTWSEEYGDADDPEQLGWLLGYSPYHHVTDGTRYPATVFTVFAGDTRVDTMHARKMTAAMQAATSAGPAERPVVIRNEVGVGHGARGLSRTIGLVVDQLQFVAGQLR